MAKLSESKSLQVVLFVEGKTDEVLSQAAEGQQRERETERPFWKGQKSVPEGLSDQKSCSRP